MEFSHGLCSILSICHSTNNLWIDRILWFIFLRDIFQGGCALHTPSAACPPPPTDLGLLGAVRRYSFCSALVWGIVSCLTKDLYATLPRQMERLCSKFLTAHFLVEFYIACAVRVRGRLALQSAHAYPRSLSHFRFIWSSMFTAWKFKGCFIATTRRFPVYVFINSRQCLHKLHMCNFISTSRNWVYSQSARQDAARQIGENTILR